MSVLDLLLSEHPAWDVEAPPECPRRSFEWYVARRQGRLDEYEREHSDPVVVLEPD